MTPAELRSIGESLYGDHWQSKLAREGPANVRTVRRWLRGERRISPMAEARIRSLVKPPASP